MFTSTTLYTSLICFSNGCNEKIQKKNNLVTEYFFFKVSQPSTVKKDQCNGFLKHRTYHPTWVSNEHRESNLNVSIFRSNVKNNFELSMCQILKKIDFKC